MILAIAVVLRRRARGFGCRHRAGCLQLLVERANKWRCVANELIPYPLGEVAYSAIQGVQLWLGKDDSVRLHEQTFLYAATNTLYVVPVLSCKVTYPDVT